MRVMNKSKITEKIILHANRKKKVGGTKKRKCLLNNNSLFSKLLSRSRNVKICSPFRFCGIDLPIRPVINQLVDQV